MKAFKSIEIQELVRLSRKYGSDPDFILEGGGNTSFKDNDYLYVKASGVPLGSIDESGFIKMNRARLKEMLSKKYPKEPSEREKEFLIDLKRAIFNEEERCIRRPSVETLLHEAISYSFVIHTHPYLINALTCSKEGKSAVLKLFPEESLWIPTINPGYLLAKKVHEELSSYRKRYGKNPHIIFLENHGLFVAADTGSEIEEITAEVVSKIKSKIDSAVLREVAGIAGGKVTSPEVREKAATIAPALRMLLMEDKSDTAICVFQKNKSIERIVSSKEAFDRLALNITPDHIVYASDRALFVGIEWEAGNLKRAYKSFVESEGVKPKIVAIEKLGIFSCGNSKKDAEAALKLFFDAVKINRLSESFGGIKPMPEEQVGFIKGWESESYRRKVLLSGSKGNGFFARRLNEKIAVVTGGAQGIGEGIARGLIKEGCNVVIADINEGKAEETAKELNAILGTGSDSGSGTVPPTESAGSSSKGSSSGKVMAVKVDVTDEDSVKNMVIDTVLEYGGLDILVSNAGVLKAGSLDDISMKDFDFVTKVNYYGYFLCTKHASQIMKIQHKFNPEYYMDIVQINSKSGLSGSRKNFAYAGGKFGGIGLTQSFALELVDFNIKVNAICPGNYFDGPLWSDPERGLFVQYLKAGKVAGARSVEDVRKYYEEKVPMRRGCKIEDINRALLYIIEQKYETGQALPVTGGQTMLK